jgi:hypothetical protein
MLPMEKLNNCAGAKRLVLPGFSFGHSGILYVSR